MSEISFHRSFAIYGRAGSGKTTLSSTFPTPILLIDILDRGTDSIVDVEDLYVIAAESLQDVEDAYWMLYDDPGEYKTIIIDTVTELQSLIVDDANKDGKGMSQRKWGEVSATLKKHLSNFRDLPMNVVFNCQERIFDIEDGGNEAEHGITPEVGPRVMPSVSSSLNAMVNILGNTFLRTKKYKSKKTKKMIRKVEYCLRVGPNPIYSTKVRNPRGSEVPDVIIDPSYDDIMAIVKGE